MTDVVASAHQKLDTYLTRISKNVLSPDILRKLDDIIISFEERRDRE
jgi:hypothetical protein